jgi:hypothetical protein
MWPRMGAQTGRAAGNRLNVSPQEFPVFRGEIVEAHADAECRGSGCDLALKAELGFSQPQANPKLGSLLERSGHFEEASAQAQDGDFPPDHGLTGRTQLRGNGAFHAGRLAALLAGGKLSGIPAGPGNSQKGFSGVRFSSPTWPPFDESPTHLTRKWTLFLPADANDFFEVELGPDAAEFGPVLAYVSGGNGFREYLPRSVGAEDAYLLFHRLRLRSYGEAETLASESGKRMVVSLRDWGRTRNLGKHCKGLQKSREKRLSCRKTRN